MKKLYRLLTGKKTKGKILDEIEKTTGYQRKQAIRLMSQKRNLIAGQNKEEETTSSQRQRHRNHYRHLERLDRTRDCLEQRQGRNRTVYALLEKG